VKSRIESGGVPENRGTGRVALRRRIEKASGGHGSRATIWGGREKKRKSNRPIKQRLFQYKPSGWKPLENRKTSPVNRRCARKLRACQAGTEWWSGG